MKKSIARTAVLVAALIASWLGIAKSAEAITHMSCYHYTLTICDYWQCCHYACIDCALYDQNGDWVADVGNDCNETGCFDKVQ